MSALVLIAVATMLAKYLVAFYNHQIIMEAIHDYQVSCFQDKIEYSVDYNDMEDIEQTVLRLWDWSYYNIIPSSKLITIRHYIHK